MKNIFVWTHHDLDGVASCLAVKWAHPDCQFNYQSTTSYTFREDFTNWLLKNRLSDFDTVFITDMDVSEDADLIDKDNVTIIDHHSTHADNKDYKFATNVIIEYSSAAKLIYKTFKKIKNLVLTQNQKILISLADDYDSYNLQVKESSILNAIFWETQNNFATFMKLYENGFNGFTQQQMNIYNIQQGKLKKVIDSLQYFENKKLKIGSQSYHVIATFANKFINEVSDHILESYKPNISIVVNIKTNHVSFRKDDDTHIDLGKLAETIADGGGHKYSAGGKVTSTFQSFTKLLKIRKQMRKIP